MFLRLAIYSFQERLHDLKYQHEHIKLMIFLVVIFFFGVKNIMRRIYIYIQQKFMNFVQSKLIFWWASRYPHFFGLGK